MAREGRDGGKRTHVHITLEDITQRQVAVTGALGLVPERDLQRVEVVLERRQHRIIDTATIEGQSLASVVDVVVRSRPDHVGRDRSRGGRLPAVGNLTVGAVGSARVGLEALGEGFSLGDGQRLALCGEGNGLRPIAEILVAALAAQLNGIFGIGREVAQGEGNCVAFERVEVVGRDVQDCGSNTHLPVFGVAAVDPGKGGLGGTRDGSRKVQRTQTAGLVDAHGETHIGT